MNIQQYLTIKQGDTKKNYLPISTPAVLKLQNKALYEAVFNYLDSDCVNQKAEQIQNAKALLANKQQGTRIFIHNLLYGVVYNYLDLVLPVNGKYQYDAGTCNGACGYGTNRVVALLGNALIETDIPLQDIQRFPQQMLIEFWTAFKSLTLAQMQGTGIKYNFRGKTCPVLPRGLKSTGQRNDNTELWQAAQTSSGDLPILPSTGGGWWANTAAGDA